jgi:DNA primase
MPRIPEPEIERIKATVELAAIVRSRGVELKKHGSRDLVGRCPFHEDKSASFVVTPAKRIFHCMGCGAAGNVIQFVERFDGLSFRHAFELLNSGAAFTAPAERVKCSTVRKMPAPLDFAADDAALLRQVADYYHERLMNSATGAAARDYLAKRGLDDEATLKRLRIGFADRSLGLTLPHKNRKDGHDIRQRLEKLGIYRESGHEHLNGCVIVPIFDDKGSITELYGRRLDDGGRSGIKHLYLPGPHVGIFNLAALDEPELILCEALLDALTFLAAGFANVTSIYGTEGFTDELFNELKRRKVQRVKLAYDADDAGERAATRDAERLRSIGIEVYRVKFPWGMDANEYARKVTPAAQSLRLLVNGAAWLGGSATIAKEPASALPSASSKNELPSPVAPAPSSLAASLVAKEEAASAPSAPCLVECGDFHTFTVDAREYRLFGLLKNNGLDTLKLTLRVRVGELMHSDQLDLCRDGDRRRFVDRAADECGLTHEAVKRDLKKCQAFSCCCQPVFVYFPPP